MAHDQFSKPLISNLVTDYIQKRRGEPDLFSFEYNLLPKLISNFYKLHGPGIKLFLMIFSCLTSTVIDVRKSAIALRTTNVWLSQIALTNFCTKGFCPTVYLFLVELLTEDNCLRHFLNLL